MSPLCDVTSQPDKQRQPAWVLVIFDSALAEMSDCEWIDLGFIALARMNPAIPSTPLWCFW
jgi:hypothetical protein